jgi:chromosome segregation protein
VLEEGADIDHTLEMLEHEEKGRAALMPLNWLRVDEEETSIDDEAIIGAAAQLIQAPAGLKAVINNLLGNVMVVRDRTAARRLIALAPKTTVLVTLKGEIFHANGAVVAGKDSRSASIGRPRQKRELQELIQSLDGYIVNLRTELTACEKEIETQRHQTTDAERKLQQVNIQLNQAIQVEQKARLNLEQANQRIDWQNKQVKANQELKEKTRKEIQALQSGLAQITTQADRFREAIRQNNSELALLPLEEFQAQEVHWNTNVAVTSRALQDAEHRMRDFQIGLEKNQLQQQSLQQRIEQTQLSLNSLEEQKKTIRAKETELNEKIDQLQQLIEPAELDLQQQEVDYNRLQEDLTAVQQLTNAAERYHTQAQLDVTRQR